MKTKMLIFLLFFSLISNVLLADIDRKVVETAYTDGWCPEGSKVNMHWKVAEWDQNGIVVRTTIRDCNGEIWVQEYDENGNPSSNILIGWIPTVISLNNLQFNRQEEAGYLSWDLTEYTVEDNDTIPIYTVWNHNCSDQSEVNFMLHEPFSAKLLTDEFPGLTISAAKIFPNPTTDIINIVFARHIFKNKVDIKIYSNSGEVFYNINDVDPSNEFNFSSSNIPAGAYMIRITEQGTGFSWISKFIKQ